MPSAKCQVPGSQNSALKSAAELRYFGLLIWICMSRADGAIKTPSDTLYPTFVTFPSQFYFIYLA